MNKAQRQSLARVLQHLGSELLGRPEESLWEDLHALQPLLEPRTKKMAAIRPRPDQTSLDDALQSPHAQP